jgi:CBS domain-containing membrane protein
MDDRTTARELMRTRFPKLPETATLRDALAAHLETAEDPDPAGALAIVAPDGSFRGLLTADGLLRALLGEAEAPPAEELLRVASDRLTAPVAEVMRRDPPVVGPDDGLPALMARAVDPDLEAVPVVEGGRIVGLVGRGDVFLAAASLALSPAEGEAEDGRPD